MTIFALEQKGTFGLDVKIPSAGGDAELGFTFVFRKVSEVTDAEKELAKAIMADGVTQADVLAAQAQHVMFIASDWALSRQAGKNKHSFDAANISTLLDSYPQAFNAICHEYAAEMNGIRRKN